ncbi:hypothetical protein [Clostridium sp. Marseille-P299]|uniref:hypothetical protein n=1 Tax=Clostridium sp. Marseille-P299 TaxID=1805477 RepID=UPI000829E09D|nr:hypothetical protein [Clostridium sp. Marseille-P299]
MTEQERIEELISMLDNFVANGGGHMNVVSDDSSDAESLLNEEVYVETYQSSDCCKGNMACAVPTLHKGIDE